MEKENVFGFSTAPKEAGDFLPIVKYDSRAGRVFRVDRVQTATGFESNVTDITNIFKAIFDFENIEVGWLNFIAGQAPDFKLVPIGSKLPAQPSANHKNGLRFMIKLSKECAADQPPIREVAGTAKAMLSGVEAIYTDYLRDKAANPGKLPVLVLEKISPVKTGTGEKSSTNYHPTFKIVGWAPRGDLVFTGKAGAAANTASTAAPAGGGGTPSATAPNSTAPSTGSTRAEAPQQQLKQMADVADDFG